MTSGSSPASWRTWRTRPARIPPAGWRRPGSGSPGSPGRRRPYGYWPDPDAPKYRKTLIVVPAEAAVIEAAAGDILDRKISLKAIARDLRERGEPTVTGTRWSAETLRPRPA